jgi:hypothetical protein
MELATFLATYSVSPEPERELLAGTNFTVSLPFTINTHLSLIGRTGTRIECATSCFLISQFNLTLTNLQIVFGASGQGLGSLVSMPVPMADADSYASLSLNQCNVQFNPSNADFPNPLVAHDPGARMVDLFVNTTDLRIHTLIEEKPATPNAGGSSGGGSGGGATPPTLPPVSFTLGGVRFHNSAVVCDSTRPRCVTVNGLLTYFVLRSTTVMYATNAAPGAVRHLIWFDGGKRAGTRVFIKNFDLEGKSPTTVERVYLTKIIGVDLSSITLNGSTKLTVEQADDVELSNSTLSMATSNDTLQFIDVGRLVVNVLTISNSAASPCMPLPQVSIEENVAPRNSAANLTAIQASGYFCNSISPDAGVVSVRGAVTVHIERGKFANITNARAVAIKATDSVRVLLSTFSSSNLTQSGFLQVTGRAEIDSQLNVENSTFSSIETDSGAAIDARNVSVVINSVMFDANRHRSSTPSAGGASLWIEYQKPMKFGQMVLEEVVFMNNHATFAALLNVSSQGQPQVHMKRVQFQNNRVNTMCLLAGMPNVHIEDFIMQGNYGTLGLMMQNPAKVAGTFTRVCICGNNLNVGSQCPIGTSFSAGEKLFIDKNIYCSSEAQTCDGVVCMLPPLTGTLSVGSATTTASTGAISNPTTGTLSTAGTQQLTTTMIVDPATQSTVIDPSGGGSTVSATIGVDTSFESGSMMEMENSDKSESTTAHNSESESSVTAQVLSIVDNAAMLGGIIGGVLGCIVLMLIGVVIAMVLLKRRAAPGEYTPTPLQQTAETGGAGNLTANSYASIQSVLPSHYGESKFSELN